MKKIVRRNHFQSLEKSNLHPLLQRIYSSRGINDVKELERDLVALLPFHELSNINLAVDCIVAAIRENQHIMIIGDFDADGATSTAVAVTALRGFGCERVSYLVPNRFDYGYGLTPEIVHEAAKKNPDLLITVDNGISSLAGVATAKSLNIKVIITDHHLPGEKIPDADAVVNPNLIGDSFQSKNLAGVGVTFYVMLAVRAKLRELNWFQTKELVEPNLASLLDLVALGTVADVVPLDKNNRILVFQGLQRIKQGRARPGIMALLEIGKKQFNRATTSDLGFTIAPRLNAAGRIDDMSLGIECLLAPSIADARLKALELDALNKERQIIESGMRDQALVALKKIQIEQNLPTGLCLYDKDWHQGVIGILASRLKDSLHRPVIAFAYHKENELKGSARSIPGLHIRDCLEAIAIQHPNLLLKFGGHAMAAGLAINVEDFTTFAQIFDLEVRKRLADDDLRAVIHTDGELNPLEINLNLADTLLDAGPWGQGFPEPIFDGQFKVVQQRLLKEKHVKFLLSFVDQTYCLDGIAFNVNLEKHRLDTLANKNIQAVYRLDINEYRSQRSVQLLIEHFEVLET